jgi:Late embryogenesis abundant protein
VAIPFAPSAVRRALPALAALAAVATLLAASGCVSKPTMHLDHAEISGVQLATLPPSIDVVMTIFLDVYNPNSYDVAVRAVRGQTVMAGRFPLPVDYHAPGDGLWLPAHQQTTVRVPLSVPLPLVFQLVQEAMASPLIPYRFQGKADVTATRSLQLEKDDYGVDEQGTVTRDQMMAVLPNSIASALTPH